jgi:RNA polymerase sigma-70 factor (ECF subfamily)
LSARYHGRELERSAAASTDQKVQSLLDQFVRAWEMADVEGLVALLKEDAILAMPPSPSWYRGRESIRAFAAATVFAEQGMFGGPANRRWRLVPTRANACPAFAIYQRREGSEYKSFGLHVVEIEAAQLTRIISFIDPSLPPRFGLPATLH